MKGLSSNRKMGISPLETQSQKILAIHYISPIHSKCIIVIFNQKKSCHNHMQEKVTHKCHKSPSLYPQSLPPLSQEIYASIAVFSVAPLSTLSSHFLLHLQYWLLGFMIQHGLSLASYHFPIIHKLIHHIRCHWKESFKRTYTRVLYTIMKERLLNWKKWVQYNCKPLS